MALDKTRLRNAIKPEIEANIRTFILSGDATAYPNLTNFADALAKAIADEVIDELVANAALRLAVCNGTVVATPGGAVNGYIENQPVTGGIE